MNLLIIGAGGHGKVVKEVAESLGKYTKIDYVDDNAEYVVGKITDLQSLRVEYEAAFVGIGNNKLRKEILTKLQAYGYDIPVLIHPTAYVSKSAVIMPGTVVEPKAIVNANSVVKEGCIISVGAIVDHDVILEPCVHVNAGAICKAGSTVAETVKLEAGQVVKGY